MDYLLGGGGGGQRICWPPSQIIGWGAAPPPPVPPSSYAYDVYSLGTLTVSLQIKTVPFLRLWLLF